jgi:hypothetical protein
MDWLVAITGVFFPGVQRAIEAATVAVSVAITRSCAASAARRGAGMKISRSNYVRNDRVQILN